jgi:hypothetical protein
VVPPAGIIVRATVVSKEVNQTRSPLALSPGRTPPRADRPAGAVLQPEPWARVKVTLSVSERFRGPAGDTLVIRTGIGDCAYPFEVGHEYLVFAYVSQGELMVSTCSATQPARMAAARIEQLRALRDGTTLPDFYGFVGTHPLRSGEGGLEEVQPMPGLTVTARSGTAEYRTQTADDGMYRFRGLPRGRYQLSVEAPPRRWMERSVEIPSSNPSFTCPMNFEVFWDGRISGTIVGRDGQQVAGMITAQYGGPETVPVTPFRGDLKDGRFEIPKLPPGRYRLMFLPTLGNRPTGPTVYYPGTQAQAEAALIEVGEGAHVEGLMFTIF